MSTFSCRRWLECCAVESAALPELQQRRRAANTTERCRVGCRGRRGIIGAGSGWGANARNERQSHACSSFAVKKHCGQAQGWGQGGRGEQV